MRWMMTHIRYLMCGSFPSWAVLYRILSPCCMEYNIDFCFAKWSFIPKILMLKPMLRVSMLWWIHTYAAFATLIQWFFAAPICQHCCAIILPWCPIYFCCYHDWWLSFVVVDYMDCMLHWLLTKSVLISWVHWLDNYRVLCTLVRTGTGLTNVANMWSGLGVFAHALHYPPSYCVDLWSKTSKLTHV